MSPQHFDTNETRSPEEREADLFARLPKVVAEAKAKARGWQAHLKDVDPNAVIDRAALADLPVLRKSSLLDAQMQTPPLGGYATVDAAGFERLFMSPGPIWEPQPAGNDAWKGARALFAAGIRAGDLVHNALSYHMTPGGFIMDYSARALGCTVFPAGIGNTDLQVQAMAALRPRAYTGTPDYLKVILDRAEEQGVDLGFLRLGLVSGGALYPSLREEYARRGVAVSQCYATADLGVIAYETEAMEGMVVNEDTIVEIVRPGTGEPVGPGEVGELVVTTLSTEYPLIRFATGDLSTVLPGQSPCGRTNMRIKGWMGRADQRTKVKGMFVDPAQIARVEASYEGVLKARLTVLRRDEQDHMELLVETSEQTEGLDERLRAALREHTGLAGSVKLVAPGSLPNDGKVISDERPLDA